MYIRACVITKAKREHVLIKANMLLVSVREPREHNRANVRLCQLIAEKYDILTKEVKIISGHHQSTKLLSLPDHVDVLSLNND